jgi:hypothetical protein
MIASDPIQEGEDRLPCDANRATDPNSIEVTAVHQPSNC